MKSGSRPPGLDDRASPLSSAAYKIPSMARHALNERSLGELAVGHHRVIASPDSQAARQRERQGRADDTADAWNRHSFRQVNAPKSRWCEQHQRVDSFRDELRKRCRHRAA
jgi:hypothetical protein